jgi:two-component system, LytTR family, sensor kinase
MNPTRFFQQLVAESRHVTGDSNNAPGKFLSKRVFPGFRIGEGLAWMLFHVSWAALIGSIYVFTDRFSDPNFMSLPKFFKFQVMLLSSKALLIGVFWWLYFVALRNVSLYKKLLLHLVTGPIFTVLCIALVNFQLTEWLHYPYPRNAMLVDVYNLLFFYVSHFAVFHAYNFWLSFFRQREREQELHRLAFQTEIKALKAQIEPHFLFNTLNSISASVPPDQEKTRMLIADLADTFRFGLKASETDFVLLEEELKFIKTWLALEQHRLKEKLVVTYAIDPRCLHVQVPPMLLQPIVENALTHGIAPKISGGAVHIECAVEENAIKVAVIDTGVGHPGDLTQLVDKGIGLKNTRRRLQLLYDQTLSVERNGEGLTVSFFIPMDAGHNARAMEKSPGRINAAP